MSDDKDSFCSCCGASRKQYEEYGHDPECVWHDSETLRLAAKWLDSHEPADWRRRYNQIVRFLLDRSNCFEEEASRLRNLAWEEEAGR